MSSIAPAPTTPSSETASTETERAAVAPRLAPFTLALPLVGIGVSTLLALRATPRRRSLALCAVGGSVGLALIRWQLQRLFSEHARYEVESRIGDIEVRLYAPTVRAETLVGAVPWGDALNEGFRRVAAYIFGDNNGGPKSEEHVSALESLATPAHVHGEKIAMTAPVLATLEEAPGSARTISFIMPGARSLLSLPKPKDSRVRLREVSAQRIAVLRFTGTYSGALPAQKRGELLAGVRARGMTPIGEVTFAGYDPPSTLPWLRRNEVMVEVTLPVLTSARPSPEK